MTDISGGRVLLFTRDEQGDQITTSRVILDEDSSPYAIAVRWAPVMEDWLCTVSSSGVDGVIYVRDRPLRHLVDVLENVVVTGRPRGALVMVTTTGLEPTRDSWIEGAVIRYFPDGIDAATAPTFLTFSFDTTP